METYKVVFKIYLRHDFYIDGRCRGVRLSLSPASSRLLTQRGILFRQLGVGEWGLISADNFPLAASDELTFLLALQDPAFLFYTEPAGIFGNELKGQSSLPFILTGADIGSITADEISLSFHARKVYWEYLFIPRKKGGLRLLEIKSTDKTFIFKEMIFHTDTDRNYYSCCSEAPVALRESYCIRLSLTENYSFGTKVVLRELPFPVAGQIPTDTTDRIQQIIYI